MAERESARSSSEPRGRIPSAPHHHPIAPTKFPTGLAAAQVFRRKRHPTVQHEPRKRRIPSADHALWAVIGLGLPPSCLIVMVAIGQSPTASNIARQQADGVVGRIPNPRGLVQRSPLTDTLPMGLSLLCGYSMWLGAGSYEIFSVRRRA